MDNIQCVTVSANSLTSPAHLTSRFGFTLVMKFLKSSKTATDRSETAFADFRFNASSVLFSVVSKWVTPSARNTLRQYLAGLR